MSDLKSLPNGQKLEPSTDGEMSVAVAKGILDATKRLTDSTIDLAVRSAEARQFLDWHTDHVRKSWLDWNEESESVLKSIRQTRIAIGIESRQLLAECGDVRKFFLSEQHEQEIAKLRDFIELAERLRALKDEGTLDRLADTILKLA